MPVTFARCGGGSGHFRNERYQLANALLPGQDILAGQ